jgi:hypothetical protein
VVEARSKLLRSTGKVESNHTHLGQPTPGWKRGPWVMF